MCALASNDTWEFVPLPSRKKIVGCRWIYVVKVGHSGEVDCLKTRLVGKGYIQLIDLTTIILYLSWPKSPHVGFFLQWLLFAIGFFTSLTLKILSSMVILRRKFTWSNLLELLPRGSLV